MFDLSKIQKQYEKIVLQYFETSDSSQTYSYADLYRESIALSASLRNVLNKTSCNAAHLSQCFNVAVLLPVHSSALLPAIVGIENTGCVSCFLDPTSNIEEIRKRLVRFQTNIILCDQTHLDKLNANNAQLKEVLKCKLFNTDCIFIQIDDLKCIANAFLTDNNTDDRSKSSTVFFYASTSGSCGEIKPIGVTYKCFLPNITSLGKLYQVTEKDVIFVSSPPTFDPFMIDICLAIHHGAMLVMTSHSLRCDASKLLDILFPISKTSTVTIMQITPSLFMRWTQDDIRQRVFSSNSQLRILAFGGERFPSSALSKWLNWENERNLVVRIFNLYGLTEMSCWAAVYEITRDDILMKRKIPIGQPIDANTKFQIADGELLLKSNIRKCFQPELTDAQVIDDEFEFILHTGDLVEVENDSIYFTCRINSVVKFYGQKINLGEIEMYTKNIDKVVDAICLHDEKHNSIALFVKVADNFNVIKKQIVKTIQKIGIHVNIYCVPQFPLTSHGKVCKNDLLKSKMMGSNLISRNQSQPIQLILQDLLNESLGTTIHISDSFDSRAISSHKILKGECDSSFVHLGGTSLKAIQIVNEFERITSKSIPYLLPMMLDEQVSIREILSRLSNENDENKNKDDQNDRNGQKVDEIVPEIVPRWQIDMKKCIDATPTVCVLTCGKTVVSVGSHSKLLYNISIENGIILSKLELPDRIESQVIQSEGNGIVGCYDGYLYCFEIRSGAIKWRFDSGAMIKCRALLSNSLVLFGNYNDTNNFWCLNAKNGTLIWSQKIGTKSIYANPIEINDNRCLVCSLNGTVALVNSLTAKIVWCFELNAPIFSTPSVFRNNCHKQQIIIATVNGNIYGLNSDGILVWNHQIAGNIFSSLELFTSSANDTCINLVFGTQNQYFYRFEINETDNCKEVWKFKTSASIRSSPIFVKNKLNLWIAVIFSSDGVVNIVDCDNGIIIRQSKINGDVFSTPVMYNGYIFIGSRNNSLYCIDLNDFI